MEIDKTEKFDKSFIFYETFSRYIDTIQSPDEKLKVYEAIAKYGLYQETPKEQTQAVYIALLIAKPIIDANLQKRENGKKGGEYGKNGGRPKKTDITENPTGVIEENPTGDIEITPNVNENYNDNGNVKKKEIMFNGSGNVTVNVTGNSNVNNKVKSNLKDNGGVCVNKANTHPLKNSYKDLFVSTYGIIEDYDGDLSDIDFKALHEAYNKIRKFLQFNPIANHLNWIVKNYSKIINDYFTDSEYKEKMQLKAWGFKAD